MKLPPGNLIGCLDLSKDLETVPSIWLSREVSANLVAAAASRMLAVSPIWAAATAVLAVNV
jgi:hypothetical protein